jgi:hypothetical protein
MSISEHFRYRNEVFQSNIFVSDIGITDVDVRCRISPTLRSMSMPTYEYNLVHLMFLSPPRVMLRYHAAESPILTVGRLAEQRENLKVVFSRKPGGTRTVSGVETIKTLTKVQICKQAQISSKRTMKFKNIYQRNT